MLDIPTTEPTKITAGDTLKWNRQDLSSDYPASTWTLTYELRGPKAITITATADGDNFSISELAATTALWTAGDYWWVAYVTSGVVRYKIDEGRVTIYPNLATKTSIYDGRSHAKKVLDAIEAVIEGRATKDQSSYSIAGRSLDRTPIEDLLLFRNKYRSEYQGEVAEEEVSKGNGTGRKITTRFV